MSILRYKELQGKVDLVGVVFQSSDNGIEQSVLQPVFGKTVLDGDSPCSILGLAHITVLQPGIKRGPGHLELELAEGQFQQFLGGELRLVS